jgi:outer membrane protein OmpA-like peptidoglycan-associated protein
MMALLHTADGTTLQRETPGTARARPAPPAVPVAGDLLVSPRIENRTALTPRDRRKGRRPVSSVYALVLHQMAFSRGSEARKYDTVTAHFAILPDGKIIQLHPVSALLWASNGFNARSVAVEFAGNFPDVRGHCWSRERFGCHAVTPAQIEAGRHLVQELVRQIGLTHVLAHRQSSGTRTNDPGPDIWAGVGQWAVNNLRLRDGGPGFKIGTGNPIPDVWRAWPAGRATGGVQHEFAGLAPMSLSSTSARTTAAPAPAPGPACPPQPVYVDCPNPGTPFEVLDNFGLDKSTLNPTLHPPRIARIVSEVVGRSTTPSPIRTILIAGHTDPEGDENYNFELSRRRALEVMKALCSGLEKARPGIVRGLRFELTPCGERQIKTTAPMSRRVEVFLPAARRPPPRPIPRPTPTPTPTMPGCTSPLVSPGPTPGLPPDATSGLALIGKVRTILGALPLVGRTGVVVPTILRFLDASEQAEARTMFGASLDFTRILISNGLGFMGRKFTVAVPLSSGWNVVMNMGDVCSWASRPRSFTLIHELVHAWQSQHHGSDPTAFMKNSVTCQALAMADIPVAKAAAVAAATTAAIGRGVFNPRTLASLAAAAAAAEDSSAYAYIPGKPFGAYAAEQVAQQFEDAYSRSGSPTASIVPTISGVAANARSAANETSLTVTSFHRRSTAGVIFH